MIEQKIKRKNRKPDDPILSAIYLILKKLKGHSIQDVLNMPIPQFLCLVEMIAREAEAEAREYKKSSKGRRSKR